MQEDETQGKKWPRRRTGGRKSLNNKATESETQQTKVIISALPFVLN